MIDFTVCDSIAQDVLPHLEKALEKNPDYTADDVSKMVGRSLNIVVMDEGDKLIGFGIIQERDFAGSKYLHDAHVWVLPEFRGRGIYTEYIDFLKSLSGRLGYRGITLNVFADEEGWEKRMNRLGFKPRAIEYIWSEDEN